MSVSPASSTALSVSNIPLDQLIAYTTNKSSQKANMSSVIIGEEALKAFSRIQDAKAELRSSECMKRSAVCCTYFWNLAWPLTVIGVAAGGGLYMIGKERLQSVAIDTSKQAVFGLWDYSWASVTGFWDYSTASAEGAIKGFAGATVASVGTVMAAYRAPRKTMTVAKWITFAAAMAIGYRLHHYAKDKANTKEQEYLDAATILREIAKGQRDVLVSTLTQNYQAYAGELHTRYRAAKKNPLDLQELQKDVALINLDVIQKEMGRCEMSRVEIDLILSKFSEIIKRISNKVISLKNGSEDGSHHAYNTALLAAFPVTSENCISKNVREHLSLVKTNKLGMLHPMKHTAANGLATMTAASSLVSAIPLGLKVGEFARQTASQWSRHFPAWQNVTLPTWPATTLTWQTARSSIVSTSSTVATGLVSQLSDLSPETKYAGIALGLLGAAYYLANKKSSHYQKEKITSEMMIEAHYTAAKQKAAETYDGMANYFENELTPGDEENVTWLKKQATLLKDKINDIQQALIKNGFTKDDAKDITARLETAISTVMDAEEVPALTNNEEEAQGPEENS